MDSINIPLNDSHYIIDRLKKILKTADNETANKILQNEILDRTNPGPGGFYDSLGSPEAWHRVSEKKPWAVDPGNTETPFVSFAFSTLDDMKNSPDGIPLAWQNMTAVLYNTPLTVRYENLDPESAYALRIKYIARGGAIGPYQTVRLTANDSYAVHDYMRIETSDPPANFDLPEKTTESGELELTWTTPDEEQGAYIAELFLMKRGR